MKSFQTLRYESGKLTLLDQRELPGKTVYMDCYTLEDVYTAIRDMVVRGAPAIGAAAAFGMHIGAMSEKSVSYATLLHIKGRLDESRPTAVNLSWATARVVDAVKKALTDHPDLARSSILNLIEIEAQAIYNEDVVACKAIGDHGSTLIHSGDTILTHCNAGALATCEYGTALGVIRSAHAAGKDIRVFADETRPRLQGARLTAWELMGAGIPTTLIPDSVAATLIRDGKVQCIVVGADCIARNGDTANKIGTFMLSIAAKMYDVPLYIAAPLSTIDLSRASGEEIEIETRDASEVTHIGGVRIAPEGVEVYNPAFDVTPHTHIAAIITEKGIARPPYSKSLPALFK